MEKVTVKLHSGNCRRQVAMDCDVPRRNMDESLNHIKIMTWNHLCKSRFRSACGLQWRSKWNLLLEWPFRFN